MVAVRNAIEADILGTDALAVTTEELLPVYAAQHYQVRQLFVARVDGRIVGRGTVSWSLADEPRVAWVVGEVLPGFRGRGIGSALFDHAEDLAKGAGRRLLQARAIHGAAEGERIASPTGFGEVPANDAGVRFMRKRGYRLEQVKRISFLDLPVSEAELSRHRRTAEHAAGPDYRVVHWIGRTPAGWIDDVAALRTRMSSDDPKGGLDTAEEIWDGTRVLAHEENRERAGRQDLTAAIEHLPSGQLVGFSELSVPRDHRRAARQGETIVLSEHRGHRLGMLLKVTNLQALAVAEPMTRLIYTFNAEENRHMLAVNESIGFRAVGYEAAWKRG
jgi:GNAT superfamily N-acetyltransferase